MEAPDASVQPVKPRGTSLVKSETVAAAPAGASDGAQSGSGSSLTMLILLGLGLVILIFLILVASKPRMIREVDRDGHVTDEISTVHTLMYSVLLAVIVGAVIWVLSKCR